MNMVMPKYTDEQVLVALVAMLVFWTSMLVFWATVAYLRRHKP